MTDSMSAASEPGVVVGRRAVLRLPALAAALLVLPRWASAQARLAQAATGAPADDAAFEAFAAAWGGLADELLAAEAPNEDAYLYRLGGLVAELPLSSVPGFRKVYEKGGLASGPAWFSGPVFVIELRMAPGALIRPHNHELYNVVTVGLSGSCQYRHFEPQPDAPGFRETGEPLVVRQTRTGLMTPGRGSSLSRTRDNVHMFVAGEEGATILDFTTQYPGAKGGDFSHLAIDEAPLDAERGLYAARWLGNLS